MGFPGHMHNPAHACGLLDSQEYVGIFQGPLLKSIAQFFPLSCLVGLLLVLSGITTSGRYNVKHLPLIIFNKGHMDFALEQAPNQGK